MDLKHIRYFLCVATHKSFSKASAELMIAQPAISRQIQLLEEDLGVKVLFRTTRGVELTSAGEELYAKGMDILESVEQLSRSLRSYAGRIHGRVSIGIPPSCSELLAPLIVTLCQQELPDVELHIIEGMTVFLEDLLGTGRIDLAILSGIPAKPSTLYSPFAEEELVLVGSEASIGTDLGDIGLQALGGVSLIMAKAFRVGVAEKLGIKADALRCAMEIDSVPAIKKIVSSGLYATILPRSLINKSDREAGLMIRSIASRPQRSLFLGAHPRMATAAVIKAVRDVLLGSVLFALEAELDGQEQQRDFHELKRTRGHAKRLPA